MRPVRTVKSRIPRFKSIAEEAMFWVTHSTADFEDEFEEVKNVKFVVRRSPVDKALTVRVDTDTYIQIADRAKIQGIGPTILVWMWILEHVRQLGKTA